MTIAEHNVPVVPNHNAERGVIDYHTPGYHTMDLFNEINIKSLFTLLVCFAGETEVVPLILMGAQL